MKLPSGERRIVETTGSTQDDLIRAIRAGDLSTGVLIARDQTHGRGRFDRVWASTAGDSLTMSLAMDGQAGHPRPWLIGMAVAAAAASALHTQIRWPNDLAIRQKKVGGMITELAQTPDGRQIAVVGVGVNLNQDAMTGELAEIATTVKAERGHGTSPEDAAEAILQAIEELPEPESWTDIKPIWMIFDDTPGKKFLLPNGETAAALGIGPDGELICSVDGETRSVMAAQAIFG